MDVKIKLLSHLHHYPRYQHLYGPSESLHWLDRVIKFLVSTKNSNQDRLCSEPAHYFSAIWLLFGIGRLLGLLYGWEY